jgi:hypothetical protein
MRARTVLSVVALAMVVFGTGCRRLLSMKGDGGAGPTIFSTLASLVGFEGEIDMSVSMPALAGIGGAGAGAMTINMKLKGDKIRMETTMAGLPSARGSATIIDGGAKKSYTLMPTSKEYLETDLDAAKKGPTAPPTTPPKPKPVVTKTGRTDKVAGYTCEIVSAVEPGTRARTEICVSKGLSFLGMGVGPFSKLGNEAGWGDALEGGFPLRMETFDTTGATLMRMEATRIDKTSEPDSEFQIPPGYKKMTMPSYGGYGGAYKGPAYGSP